MLKKCLIWGFVFFVFIFPTPTINSATNETFLYLTPPTESYYTGKIFSSAIRVTSLDNPLNAIEGTLRYSRDTIELIDISKSGSIVSIWLDGPIFSNKDGTISFSGGIPSPGFTGNGGRVLTLTFRAIADGPATITWERSAVLANDGRGTEILTSTEDANHIINNLNGVEFGNTGPEPDIESDVEMFSLQSPILYLTVTGVMGIILVMFFIMRAVFIKKSIRENIAQLERGIKKDMRVIEKELEDHTKKSRISEDFKDLKENIEEDIDEIEKKLY